MQKIILFTFLSILLFIGCATIITGSKQDISINSNPSMAKVVVKTTGGLEVFSGTTPTTCKLKKKHEYIVYITMDGYKEQTIMIDQKFNGWVLGNLICGGILGLVVDAVSGAMYNLEPQTIYVTLATVMKDGVKTTYAVLFARDNEGQLRSIAVPMVQM